MILIYYLFWPIPKAENSFKRYSKIRKTLAINLTKVEYWLWAPCEHEGGGL